MALPRDKLADSLQKLSDEELAQIAAELDVRYADQFSRTQLIAALLKRDRRFLSRSLRRLLFRRRLRGVAAIATLSVLFVAGLVAYLVWSNDQTSGLGTRKQALLVALEKELGLYDDRVVPFSMQAVAYEAAAPTDRARRLAKHFTEDDPHYPQALQAIAQYRYDEARTQLSRLRPGRNATELKLARANAITALYANRYKEAVSEYRHALELVPDHPRFLNRIAECHVRLGMYDSVDRYFARTLESLAGAQGQLLFDYKTTLRNRAAFYEFMGRYADAEHVYRRLLEIELERTQYHAMVLLQFAGLMELGGRFEEARAMLEESLTILRDIYSSEKYYYLFPSVRLHTLNGDYVSAAAAYNEAMERFEWDHGAGHPHYTARLPEWARLLVSTGDVGTARDLFEQARIHTEHRLGSDHPLHAFRLLDVAGASVVLGDYSAAARAANAAGRILRENLGEDHVDYSQALGAIGHIAQISGDLREAEDSFRQAIEIVEKSLGTNHVRIVPHADGLGDVYFILASFSEGETAYERALTAFRESFGDRHPGVAQAMAKLSSMYAAAGKSRQAESYAHEALAIALESAPPQHPNIAVLINNVALIQAENGNAPAAIESLQHARTIQRAATGEGNASFAALTANLALAHARADQTEQADRRYREAQSLYADAIGPDHPITARVLHNYAIFLASTDRPAEARAISEQALAIDRARLAPDNYEYAFHLTNYGTVLIDLQEYAAAERALTEAQDVLEATFGPGHLHLVQTLEQRARVLQATGRDLEGHDTAQRARTIREKYAPATPSTVQYFRPPFFPW